MPDRPTLAGGRVLASRYRLVQPIARGGMAEVWEGYDEVLARAVAIKILHQHLAGDEAFIERFRREAISAAKLAHPNVVATFDAGTEDEDAYIVMELVRGRTLRQCLSGEGPLPPAVATSIGIQIADALGHAHSHGIIHRDVKPANILLCESDTLTSAIGTAVAVDPAVQAKVADFGVAKAAAGWGSDLTKTGTVVGTAKYLSPEQVEGHEPDARSDLYALGIVLYEMLCGEAPFVGDTELSTAMAHLERDPRPPRQVQAGIPRPLEAVVLRALSRDPAGRPPSAADLRAELATIDFEPDDATSFITTDPTPPEPMPIPETAGVTVAARPDADDRADRSRRSRAPLVLAVIVVGALLALGAAFISRPRHADDAKPGPSTQTSSTAKPLAIASADAFDPPPGDSEEHNEEAGKAHDGNQATFWETQDYNTNRFGGLKQGVGLIVRLNNPSAVHQLRVSTPTNGWSAQIYLAEAPHAALAEWGQPVADRAGLNGDATFDLGGRTGGAILIWLTQLGSDGRAEIHEVGLS